MTHPDTRPPLRSTSPHANAVEVAAAMSALGAAYRGDWSLFDGRTLRSQLDELAGHLTGDKPVTYARLCADMGVCPVSRSWPEHCEDRSEDHGVDSCPHIAEALAPPAAPAKA